MVHCYRTYIGNIETELGISEEYAQRNGKVQDGDSELDL